MKKIICFIYLNQQYSFFKRLNKTLRKHFDTELVFVTNRLSTFLRAKAAGEECALVKEIKNLQGVVNDLVINESLEYQVGYINHSRNKKVYLSDLNTLEYAVEKYGLDNIRGIINWNGSSIHSIACKHISVKYNFPILFAEIANFKDKLFIDKEGTNADASIAKNKNLLLKYDFDEEKYLHWKADFIESRANLSMIPQAKKKDLQKLLRMTIYELIDEIGYLSGWVTRDRKYIFSRFIKALKAKRILENISKLYIQEIPEKFVFLPLQTSEDSNLILRSEVDNIQAIEKTLEVANKKKIPLVIKLHPADQNPEFLSSLHSYLLKHPEIIVTNINAFILAQKSTECFTINSTLGLEAMIYNIDVNILGYALYRSWKEKHIKHYVGGFLLDMSYFNQNTEISRESVELMLSRLES